MLGDHADHGRRVPLVAGERPHAPGDLRGLAIRAASHQRGNRRGIRAALVGVVRQAARHQERAQVRVTEPELAVVPRVLLDLGRGVGGEPDEDLLGEEDRIRSVLERLDVELAVLAAELHKV